MTSPAAPRTLRAGVLLAIGLLLATVLLDFATAALLPGVFRWVEALGDYRLKPWIFAAPAPIAFVGVLVLAPGFRSIRSVAGFLVGTFATLLVIAAVGYVIVSGVVGSAMHG